MFLHLRPHGMWTAQVVMKTALHPFLRRAELPPRPQDVLHLPQNLLQRQQERQDHQEDTPPVLRQRGRQVRPRQVKTGHTEGKHRQVRTGDYRQMRNRQVKTGERPGVRRIDQVILGGQKQRWRQLSRKGWRGNWGSGEATPPTCQQQRWRYTHSGIKVMMSEKLDQSERIYLP